MLNGMNLCLRFLLLCGLLLHPLTAHPADGPPAMLAQGPAAEHHVYNLDFIFFRNLAEGELKLETTDNPDVLRAELVGRTLGIAAWLTGDRTQRYTAFMEKQKDGSLRSLTFESQVVKRKNGRWKTTHKRFRFDERRHRVFLEKARNGIFSVDKQFEFQEGQSPVDILTGFYNLRAGRYGEVRSGRRLQVPTVTSKGFGQIEVAVLTPEEGREIGFFPKEGILLQVTLDPEVFETSAGGMYIWFDETGRPARGAVEDVIGLGDVKGFLREGRQP